MMHATAADLELFVTQALSPERSAWLERHCEACDGCAEAVRAEARLELGLRAMTAERRCGMRADATVVPLPVARPASHRPAFYAFAAAACIALAFVAARLPRAVVQQPAPMELYADAGDLTAVKQAMPGWAAGEPSGGTP